MSWPSSTVKARGIGYVTSFQVRSRSWTTTTGSRPTVAPSWSNGYQPTTWPNPTPTLWTPSSSSPSTYGHPSPRPPVPRLRRMRVLPRGSRCSRCSARLGMRTNQISRPRRATSKPRPARRRCAAFPGRSHRHPRSPRLGGTPSRPPLPRVHEPGRLHPRGSARPHLPIHLRPVLSAPPGQGKSSPTCPTATGENCTSVRSSTRYAHGIRGGLAPCGLSGLAWCCRWSAVEDVVGLVSGWC